MFALDMFDNGNTAITSSRTAPIFFLLMLDFDLKTIIIIVVIYFTPLVFSYAWFDIQEI